MLRRYEGIPVSAALTSAASGKAAQARAEEVIRREAPALVAYFERRTPPSDAPDLLGETLLVAWRRAASLPADDQAARMWLFGVARRVLSTYHRGNIRRHALAERLRMEREAAPAASPHDSELSLALAELAPIDSEIIRLLHWDGFTLLEIAQHLGRPAGTIRSRYSRARTALRARLEEGTPSSGSDRFSEVAPLTSGESNDAEGTAGLRHSGSVSSGT
ncbi:RNA polymerase sigma factor [Leifsonia shinshuensis]|uniref:RNA polymerase sigma factor n=1 Tax=Leifsonia shinshuensis TaxID=150026 RepID=UPI0031B5A8B7